MKRYRKHLTSYLKDRLAESEKDQSTLENLINVTITIDKRKRERDAERNREQGKSTPSSSSSSSLPPRFTAGHALAPPSAPVFQAPPDPDAMDISATMGRTVEAWRKAMAGRCFGCGSKDHIFANGGHNRTICDWCRKAGHTVDVCRTRWMGRPKVTAQRVAATDSYPSPPTSVASSSSPPSSSGSTPASEGAVSALIQQVAALQAQIREVKGDFS